MQSSRSNSGHDMWISWGVSPMKVGDVSFTRSFQSFGSSPPAFNNPSNNLRALPLSQQKTAAPTRAKVQIAHIFLAAQKITLSADQPANHPPIAHVMSTPPVIVSDIQFKTRQNHGEKGPIRHFCVM